MSWSSTLVSSMLGFATACCCGCGPDADLETNQALVYGALVDELGSGDQVRVFDELVVGGVPPWESRPDAFDAEAWDDFNARRDEVGPTPRPLDAELPVILVHSDHLDPELLFTPVGFDPKWQHAVAAVTIARGKWYQLYVFALDWRWDHWAVRRRVSRGTAE